MILVETSAWVEYDRATGSAVDRRLTSLVTTGGIAVTEPVMTEVLAGARDEAAAEKLRRLLLSFDWVGVESVSDFDAAARIHRECRRRGITPRGLVDCLIAAVALRTGCPVLTADGDFSRIARAVPLRLAD